MPDQSDGSRRYWIVVFLLCLVAIPSIFSIGMPLLLLAVTLAAVAPWRTQRAVLWPAVIAVLAFVSGYLLVAPLGCSTTASAVDPHLLPQGAAAEAQTTSCSSVLGIDYSGAASYNPSHLPALIAGLAIRPGGGSRPGAHQEGGECRAAGGKGVVKGRFGTDSPTWLRAAR